MERLEVYLDHATLSGRIARMAREIERDLDGEPVVLVGILKGSLHFLSDLGRMLKVETTVEFMQVSSYGAEKASTGAVQIRKDLDADIEGRNVLIVEDIVDSGLTLSYLRGLLEIRNPKSLRAAALLSKPDARRMDAKVDYVGFEISNDFVVGYGLDYAERYRNLPYIAILRED